MGMGCVRVGSRKKSPASLLCFLCFSVPAFSKLCFSSSVCCCCLCSLLLVSDLLLPNGTTLSVFLCILTTFSLSHTLSAPFSLSLCLFLFFTFHHSLSFLLLSPCLSHQLFLGGSSIASLPVQYLVLLLYEHL